MKIQLGEVKLEQVRDNQILPNKTRKYLLPCLKDYGEEFMYKLNSVYKIASGIGDMIVENSGIKKYEKHIFILIDTNIARDYFKSFMEYIKDHNSYEDDYVFGNLQKSNYHMVVIRFPEKYTNSIEFFKIGKYSKMFSKETIDSYFEKVPDAQKVMIRDKNYKIVFTRRINKLFGTNLKPEDWDPEEYEIPPTKETEVFNHHIKPK